MRIWLFLGCMVTLAGCNAPKYAPVSGVVTLNGKPLADAMVSFQMIVEEDPLKAPPSAAGKTNQNGEYSLKSRTANAAEKDGAIPGSYKVVIALINPATIDRDKRRGAADLASSFEQLPARYNVESTLTCDVPPEGKKDANFQLTAP
jgi:hypothetical protein